MGAELSSKATVEDLLASMKKLTRESVNDLNKEMREIDILINKVRLEMQEMAKLNYDCSQGMRALAKAIVLGEKGKREISLQITRITNLERELRLQAANYKVHSLIKEATPVMEVINKVFTSSEFKEGMINMSKELHKMGIIEDVMNSQLDNAMDTTATDEDDEIKKVLDQFLKEEQAKNGSLPVVMQHEATVEGNVTSNNESLNKILTRISSL